MRRLDDRLGREHGQQYANLHFRVFTDDHPSSSTPWFPANWSHVSDAASADYVISKRAEAEGRVLFAVRRYGVPLNYVRIGRAEGGPDSPR